MKKSRSIFVISLIVMVGVWWWLRTSRQPEKVSPQTPPLEAQQATAPSQPRQRRSAPTPAPTPANAPKAQSGTAAIENRIKQVETDIQTGLEEWRTPIEFYGKVVDENTNPVANADVQFVWTDLSPKGNSEKATTSDVNGLFSLRNEAGKHLIVKVSKQGYYSYQPFGAPFFYAGENQNFVPNAAKPVVFRLKKKGVAEPLVHVQSPMGGPKGFKIPKDGTAVEISLSTGKAVLPGQGDFRVQCWTDSEGKASGEHYDWTCQISVPNGGLLVSTNELDFEAPLDGYQSADVIQMRATSAGDWSSHAKRNYFLKLGNGNYARVSFEMVAGGDHFFQIESFLNPSGSRGLEFDRQLAINP